MQFRWVLEEPAVGKEVRRPLVTSEAGASVCEACGDGRVVNIVIEARLSLGRKSPSAVSRRGHHVLGGIHHGIVPYARRVQGFLSFRG